MRRSGFTNAIQSPITWNDSTIVGASSLNIYLRENFLAIDNRISPYLPDVVHFTPPADTFAVSDKTVFMASGQSGINISALNEYSPNVALSIDASFSLEDVTASGVLVEAAVILTDLEAIGTTTKRQTFRYRMFRTQPVFANTLKDPPFAVATNFIGGVNLGNTNYGVWSGFVRQDIVGNNPFSLVKPTYSVQTMLAMSATNGSVTVRNPVVGTRFRTNVGVSVVNPATNFVPDVWIFGAQAV